MSNNQPITETDRWTLINALGSYRRACEVDRDLCLAESMPSMAHSWEQTMLIVDRLSFQIQQADAIFING